MNARQAFGRSGCPLGRDPATRRYRYAHATVHGGRRDAQREAARLVSEASRGRIPLTNETFGGLLDRWLDHIEVGPVVHGFVQTIRDRHPTTPITIISPILSPEREDSAVSNIPILRGETEPFVGDLTLEQMREIVRDVVERRRQRGDGAIDYLDGRELPGAADVEHLPDGLHPSPSGYALMRVRFASLFA